MTSFPNTSRMELAQRRAGQIDVTLVWVHGNGTDETLVCVCDHAKGVYFEIPAELHLALDVYNHPFFDRDFSTVDYEDNRLAA